PERTGFRFTQTQRLFEHRVEHRGEVTGRGIDDTEHLCSRGLLLQRLACLSYEPSVFDGYDGLVSKRVDKRYFCIRERLSSFASKSENTYGCPVPQEWNAKHRMDAADPRILFCFIKRISPSVLDVYRASLKRCASHHGSGPGYDTDIRFYTIVL